MCVVAWLYSPHALASYATGDATSHDVMTTIAADPWLMPRPRQIYTSGANGSFNTGPYSYDAAGNVLAIGSNSFGYDAASRLTSTNLFGVGSQTYAYDVFGNLLTRTGGPTPLSLTVDASTNRVNGYFYDFLGNLTSAPGEVAFLTLNSTTGSSIGSAVRYSKEPSP